MIYAVGLTYYLSVKFCGKTALDIEETGLWVEMERAHIFLARAELELPKSSPSRARALDFFIIEPSRASFKQAHTDASNHHAYILPITKLKHHLGFSEPRAYLLCGKNQARAFEPEPRLIPPLVLGQFLELIFSFRRITAYRIMLDG